jgi:hypothetical protein
MPKLQELSEKNELEHLIRKTEFNITVGIKDVKRHSP